jgi:hypothetical protein
MHYFTNLFWHETVHVSDTGTVQNMHSFMPKLICEISASSWFYYKEICYDAWPHEHKIFLNVLFNHTVNS